jgi:hypothetical protein
LLAVLALGVGGAFSSPVPDLDLEPDLETALGEAA